MKSRNFWELGGGLANKFNLFNYAGFRIYHNHVDLIRLFSFAAHFISLATDLLIKVNDLSVLFKFKRFRNFRKRSVGMKKLCLFFTKLVEQ